MSGTVSRSLVIVLAVVLVGVLGLAALSTGAGTAPTGQPTREMVLRGRYLVTAAAGCQHCHQGADPNDLQWLAGSSRVFQVGAFKVYASNLTPDPTGLGTWTAQQVFDSLRLGKAPDGKYLAPPMPWPGYRNLSDDDLGAIVAYLRSIKPVANAVPVSEGPNAAPGQRGDWSASYEKLQPFPEYPGTQEIPVD
ncbi:MAG TPA: c-type cytochrome [Armatimonadota bacterium]|jgi:mono/diheme cytochrome c family protein